MTMTPSKRALILAGGGLKVAFQAGVLQVWLDEAEMTFDYVDGASGGTLNLAMYCQGMRGTQIADNWRRFRPLRGIAFNPPFCRSLLSYDRFRKHTFTQWGLDFARIRASEQAACFNLYNFSRHELACIAPQDMTEDHLIGCISLPVWFPPVEIGEDLYIDSVYHTDANVERAIQLGADELWVIWTVSQRGEWRNNIVNNYFQIIEASANGRFKEIIQRVEANNARIDAGQAGEFGRRIGLRILRHEVPIHYLITLRAHSIRKAVDLGVAEARRWWTTQPDLPPLPAPNRRARPESSWPGRS
jgi:predicted acylesterase/phospholipase RssA